MSLQGRKDLKALLEWSIVHGDPEKQKTVKPMDEETKEWLSEALSQHVVDPIKRIKECFSIIDDDSSMDNVKHIALDEIAFYVEQKVDIANDFHKIGGLKRLVEEYIPKFFQNEKLLERVLDIITTCSHNNPYIQNVLLTEMKDPYAPKLIQIMLDPKTSPVIQRKALSALTALLSNNLASTKYLIQEKQTLQQFLLLLGKSTDTAIKRKIVFMLYNMLLNEKDQLLQLLLSQGFLAILRMSCLSHVPIENVDLMEFTLRILIEMLSSKHKDVVGKTMQDLNFRASFEDINKFLQTQKRASDEDEFFGVRDLLSEIKQTF